MNIDYIIVQAGGKGTRLRPYTSNKPKSLVTVNNKPILFHLFDKYPDKKFIVIGDYKFDVLERYLEIYASVDYLLIKSVGEGNSAGLKKALSYIPEATPFMLVWSDLILANDFSVESFDDGCYLGTTDKFTCSWCFVDGVLEKKKVNSHGVAGCFIFENKGILHDISDPGSVTQFLKESCVVLHEFDMGDCKEVGTREALRYLDNKDNRCRPYNRITMFEDQVVKEGLTDEAKKLIEREIAWYKAVDEKGFKGIPQVYKLEPLTLARINGDNIFKFELSEREKIKVIDNLVLRLNELHDLVNGDLNYFDMQEDYYNKTMKRLRSIRDVVPFSNDEYIIINGRKCINVIACPDYLKQKVDRIISDSNFGIIHGDCTLTNTLMDENFNIYFIDARGYFGKTPLIGDVYYDWAKVYYSIEGKFDQFNIRNFELNIKENEISFSIGASGWENLTEYFLNKIQNCDLYRLKLIHAIVWLSLASHCSDDYDSLCLAFYNGLYLLNTLED